MSKIKAVSYAQTAIDYAAAVIKGEKIAGKRIIEACQRFLDDLKRDDIELRTREPDFVINIVKKTMVHRQGEAMDGSSLVGKPLILEPW